jgi:hypothetical protein
MESDNGLATPLGFRRSHKPVDKLAVENSYLITWFGRESRLSIRLLKVAGRLEETIIFSL